MAFPFFWELYASRIMSTLSFLLLVGSDDVVWCTAANANFTIQSNGFLRRNISFMEKMNSCVTQSAECAVEDILMGVNYASGGDGIRDETGYPLVEGGYPNQIRKLQAKVLHPSRCPLEVGWGEGLNYACSPQLEKKFRQSYVPSKDLVRVLGLPIELRKASLLLNYIPTYQSPLPDVPPKSKSLLSTITSPVTSSPRPDQASISDLAE
ncbi:hypothetical protein TEA_014748 [Camellia sinensis var. sinensis]|uniref:Uncharacterized protein n=1 Tax=Camellia sinensis var. sinensis TaxID=542762 RepID=A0A4S4ELX7_CAMSN|nr:hypothetical protein TEA_014748 [Camellia sinensis var. sinensis]